VSAYSTGLDIKFICEPLCFRLDADTTVTWTLFDEKGDVKLTCWTQRGVDSTSHTIQFDTKNSAIRSLISIDEIGEAIMIVHDNSRFECYKNGQSVVLWTWDPPMKSRYIQTFKATECSLTQNLGGFIMLLVSEHAGFYRISSAAQPSEAVLTVPLPEVSSSMDHLTLDI
jgi:hypothetical protein